MPTYADLLREKAEFLDADFAKHRYAVVRALLEIAKNILTDAAEETNP